MKNSPLQKNIPTTRTKRSVPAKGKGIKTYQFKVVIEPDEAVWSAYCPALKDYGAVTWGKTREEAIKHIHEVVGMVVQEIIEDGKSLPKEVRVYQEPLVSITV